MCQINGLSLTYIDWGKTHKYYKSTFNIHVIRVITCSPVSYSLYVGHGEQGKIISVLQVRSINNIIQSKYNIKYNRADTINVIELCELVYCRFMNCASTGRDHYTLANNMNPK